MKIEDIEGIGPAFGGNLARTFQELDAARPNWIRQIPGEATIAGWIEQAGALGKIVSH